MTPYIVAAFFGDAEQGQLVTNAVIAPNSELAAAVTVREAARQTDAGLLSVAVSPLTREFLTSALRALDGKTLESGKAEVVQLVVPNMPTGPYQVCAHGVPHGLPCATCAMMPFAQTPFTDPGAA